MVAADVVVDDADGNEDEDEEDVGDVRDGAAAASTAAAAAGGVVAEASGRLAVGARCRRSHGDDAGDDDMPPSLCVCVCEVSRKTETEGDDESVLAVCIPPPHQPQQKRNGSMDFSDAASSVSQQPG